MHLGEGLLPAAHATAWSAGAAPAFIVGLRRLRGGARVRAGLATALTFAVTLFPVPIVWATHDLERLPRPVRRLVLLAGGRVVFDGARNQGLEPGQLRAAGLRR